MESEKKVSDADLAEMQAQQAILEARAEELRARLEKGVPQAEFKQLHTLSSAIRRAAGALEAIRAEAQQSSAED